MMCFKATQRFAVHNTLTPPMPAPGGHARRIWGDAFANGMPATSSRKHSPPTNGASPKFTARYGVSVSENAAKIVPAGVLNLTDWNCRDVECPDTAFVGGGRP